MSKFPSLSSKELCRLLERAGAHFSPVEIYGRRNCEAVEVELRAKIKGKTKYFRLAKKAMKTLFTIQGLNL